MRHGNKSRHLGVKSAHRIAMLRNLVASLVEHGRIRTTTARAKSLRPFLEPIVTRLKNPSIHNVRLASATLGNRKVAQEIAHKISPALKDRPGGYLRILKLAQPRVGDAADMSLVEWTEASMVPFYEELKSSAKGPKKKTAAKKKAPAKKKSAAKKTKAK